MTNRITEKTLMPVSLVIVLVVLAASISKVRSDTIENAANIERIDTVEIKRIELKADAIQKIDRRLSRIEGALGIKPRNDEE